MSDDDKPVAVGYSDRWRWLKSMLAQPPEILGNGVKVVLVAIWEAMDKQTGITVRLQGTIADATGLKPGTVKDYLSVARKAGFIHSEGKGGHIYDETGKKVPLASRYRLALPATIVATWVASSDESASKGRSEGEQVAIESAASSDNSRYDTPSVSPSSSPIVSPGAAEESPPRERVADQIQSDRKNEVETQELESRPLLPVASFEERGAWAGRWPDTDERLRFHNRYIGNRKAAELEIGTELALALGWTAQTARDYEKANGEYPFSPVLRAMRPEWREALLDEMVAGKATRETLVNLLATMGFEPISTKEEKNAQVS